MEQRSFRNLAAELYFEESENRICRVIVVGHLYPIYALDNLETFKEAFRQIVLAHHFNSETRVLRRDISLNNLMFRRVDNGTVQGVLIDLDLASVGEPTGETHLGGRIETRRFMARELLVTEDQPEAPVHLERFGWESFFYVLCWIGTHYSAGGEIRTEAFDEWDMDKDGVVEQLKSAVVTGAANFTRKFTGFYRPVLFSWVKPMQEMFDAANKAKSGFEISTTEELNPGGDAPNFDETLGGSITWERFWMILQK